MEENLKPTTEVLNIFIRVRNLIYKEMKDLQNEFSFNTYEKNDKNYILSVDDYVNYILSTYIVFERSNKCLRFSFAEIQTPSAGTYTYKICIYMENYAVEMYSQTLFIRYYLKITDRQHLVDLFPQAYIAKIGEVDETKIYEYVHEYLNALKVMFAEPDFQKLLYDPEFWVYANPYK